MVRTVCLLNDMIVLFKGNNKKNTKIRPNKQVIEELMAQSFAMRWNDLHDNSYDLEAVFEKYPFLADVSQASLFY